MNGYIYLATNSDFPTNTVLIGKSETDPRYLENISNRKTRIKSQIKYYAYVEDYDLVHFSLDLRFKDFKKNSNDFFFDCSILEAIRNIKELSTILSEESYFEKSQIYKDHERKKIERADKKAEEERKQQEIAAKKAEEEKKLKLKENKMNNGDDFDKKVKTSNTQANSW